MVSLFWAKGQNRHLESMLWLLWLKQSGCLREEEGLSTDKMAKPGSMANYKMTIYLKTQWQRCCLLFFLRHIMLNANPAYISLFA